MTSFRAFVVDERDGEQVREFRDLTIGELPEESVLVDVAYSCLNYKDGLAVTGKGKIVRKFPMVCGIDLAGIVSHSSDPNFAVGDRVLVNGWGMSEYIWGGYSTKARVDPSCLTRAPENFSLLQTMAIGTAGYTAMLCVLALEDAGVQPSNGSVVVTGASGGVGSVAVSLLARLGYTVTACTGRTESAKYLSELGATEVVTRDTLDRQAKPLEGARWAGGIDCVGSKTLATVLAQTQEEGAVAACGLAGGVDLPTTVLPFILRGVKLLGINSVTMPNPRRQLAWDRLAQDLDKEQLDAITVVEPLSNIKKLADQILNGKIRGRVVIDVNA